MVDRIFTEKLFRDLCRQARASTKKPQTTDPLLALLRLLYQTANLREPADIGPGGSEIFYMNQILTFVEMRMNPPFGVRRVILEEIYQIKSPRSKQPSK